MSYLSPWGQARGGRAVGGTFLPPVGKRARRGSVTMDVGSVLLRDVSFGVAMRISVFGWGGVLFPGVYVGSFRSDYSPPLVFS